MRVIVLNGTSSAGKSTLAGELQRVLESAGECWIVMSQDEFFEKLPLSWLTYGHLHVGTRADEGFELTIVDGVLTRRAGPVGHRFLDAYRAAIAAMARTGVNVIVDEVLLNESDWTSWQEHLRGLNVLWVGVVAELEVLEQRERDRGDRFIGLARSEHDIVHRHALYDIYVDTGDLDPKAAAAAILASLTQ